MRDNLHCCHFRSDQLARSDQLVRCSSDQLVRWIFFGRIIARRGLGCRVALFHGAGVRGIVFSNLPKKTTHGFFCLSPWGQREGREDDRRAARGGRVEPFESSKGPQAFFPTGAAFLLSHGHLGLERLSDSIQY